MPEADSLIAVDETCMMLMLIMMLMLMLMLILTLNINVDEGMEINFDVNVAVDGDVDAVFDDFVDCRRVFVRPATGLSSPVLKNFLSLIQLIHHAMGL